MEVIQARNQLDLAVPGHTKLKGRNKYRREKEPDINELKTAHGFLNLHSQKRSNC